MKDDAAKITQRQSRGTFVSNIKDDEPKKQVSNPRALKVIDGGRVTQDPDYVDPLEVMNREWFVIQDYGGKCVVARWIGGRLQTLSKKDFLDGLAHMRMGRKEEAIATEWFKWSKRRTFSRVEFGPGLVLPSDVLNLWTGFAINPAPGAWHLIEAHIHDVLAAGVDADYYFIIQWCAWVVQFPSLLPESALVFIGKMGAGKGFFGSLMKDIHGRHGLHAQTKDHFAGRYNDHLEYTRLCFADEAVIASRETAKLMLTRITEKSLTVEGKWRHMHEVRNYLAFIMASNPAHIINASRNERRYSVFEPSSKHAYKEEDNESRKSYFNALYEQKDAGGAAAFLDYLLNYDLGLFHPREVHETAALENQRELTSADPWRAIFEQRLGDHWPNAVDMIDVLNDWLSIPKAQQDRACEMRAGAVLAELGYITESRYDTVVKKTRRRWFKC